VRRDAFPFRVDDVDDLAASFYQYVGLSLDAATILNRFQAVEASALQKDRQAGARERSPHNRPIYSSNNVFISHTSEKPAASPIDVVWKPAPSNRRASTSSSFPPVIRPIETDPIPTQRMRWARG
jgi:hypothetical protein